ncbi:MAG: hypothetical protein ATN31_08535 [Candidatus Epulonipiscioides saccharophilum]|nr:MAG: hypothetical protein ATN31_08535 [Epulopiscium sp. AS2M-Bin001]
MFIAGLDIGTTGSKCSVYDHNGQPIKEVYQEYSVSITKEAHTVNVNLIWNCVLSILNEISSEIKHIDAICVTSFGEASVLLDESDNPLTDAYLFTDPNGEAQCQSLVDAFGEDFIFDTTGLVPGKMYSVAKWLWIKHSNPQAWAKCKKIALIEDYIVYKLSGVHQIDYSLATRTMAFDIQNLSWNKKILEFAEISESLLPNIVPIGTIADRLLDSVNIGFTNRPLIVSGCHDQVAAAIGTGVLKEKTAVDGTGTVECLTAVFKSGVNTKILQKCGYAIVPYIDNLYITYAFTYTGGALLKWYRNQFAPSEDYAKFNLSVDNEHPSGLLILPHFAGSGTPYPDSLAKGAILGLTLDSTKEQIYQALMEGPTYEMKLNLNKFAQAGADINTIYATGGGASSKEWLQIKADIMEKEIITLKSSQSGTLGCIMLAGVACGIYKDLHEAAKKLVLIKDVYNPNPDRVKEYQCLYKEYEQLYPKLYL